MKQKHTTPRILSILILLGLVIAQLGAVHPAQAATDVTLMLDDTTYAGLPGQAIPVTVTETFGDFSREKNNISYDLLFTFSVPVGIDLRDTSVQAYTSGGAQIGSTIRLNSGQTYLWASAFGGALSRHKVKAENGTSHTYQFVFTPTASLAGKSIGVKTQIAVAKNGFTATSAWKYSSSEWNATLKVRSLPVLTAERISGPYKNNIEGTFRIEVANPDPELVYSGLHLMYQIDNDGTTVPNIKTLGYRYSLDNGSTWSTLTNIPKTQGGEFGPGSGYTLDGGQKLLVEVAIKFNNNISLFPFTLTLEYPQGKTLESLSAVAAVEIDKARLASNDLGVTYNAGITQEFHLTAVNQPDTGGTFTDAYMKLTFGGMAPADIAQLQYYSPSDGLWKDVSPITATGSGAVGKFGPFTIDTLNNISRTVKFRATFIRPGTYATAATLETSTGNPIADTPLLATVVVSASYPSLDLTDILNNSPFTEQTLQEFVVGISNPATGGAYNSLRLDCVISSTSLAGILQFDYSLDNGGTWVPITLSPNAAGGVTGSVNPSNWSLAVSQNLSVKFRINFAAAQDHVMTFTLVNQTPSVTLATSSAYILLPGLPVTGVGPIYLPFINID